MLRSFRREVRKFEIQLIFIGSLNYKNKLTLKYYENQ